MWSPAFALSFSDLQQRFSQPDAVQISTRSVLCISSENVVIESLSLDGSLYIIDAENEKEGKRQGRQEGDKEVIRDLRIQGNFSHFASCKVGDEGQEEIDNRQRGTTFRVHVLRLGTAQGEDGSGLRRVYSRTGSRGRKEGRGGEEGGEKGGEGRERGGRGGEGRGSEGESRRTPRSSSISLSRVTVEDIGLTRSLLPGASTRLSPSPEVFRMRGYRLVEKDERVIPHSRC